MAQYSSDEESDNEEEEAFLLSKPMISRSCGQPPGSRHKGVLSIHGHNTARVQSEYVDGKAEVPVEAGLPAGVGLAAMFVEDCSLPDKVHARPGTLSKSWRIRNNGLLCWPAGIEVRPLAPAGELAQSQSAPLPLVQVGEDVVVEVELVAPSQDGLYEGRWALFRPGSTVPLDQILTASVIVDTSVAQLQLEVVEEDCQRLPLFIPAFRKKAKVEFQRAGLATPDAASAADELIQSLRHASTEAMRSSSRMLLAKTTSPGTMIVGFCLVESTGTGELLIRKMLVDTEKDARKIIELLTSHAVALARNDESQNFQSVVLCSNAISLATPGFSAAMETLGFQNIDGDFVLRFCGGLTD
eukprot:m.300296 g.300296  ORF g.300296 m.300296 type:complete len:356 (+) comp14412_c0_seq1:180-1247(+)